MFSLICGIEAEYKYKHVTNITEHVPQSGTGKGDKRKRKRRKER
jgi:hypothetical protein